MDIREKIARKNKQEPRKAVVYDSADSMMVAEDAAAIAEVQDLRKMAASIAQQFAETDESDLEEGETLVDRLDALVVGVCDTNKNGEIDDDEQEIAATVYDMLAEYMAGKGASEDDISLFLDDGDEEAALRIQELLLGTLPNGEDESMADIDSFTFDADSDASVMDAAYRKVVAIRAGKRTVMRKRIAGKVRLSSKQKLAIAKMQRKSHSARARLNRMKSMKKRRSMGL